MSQHDTLTGMFDDLPWLFRMVILIVGGAIVGGVYRLVRWTETKTTSTLVVGLLATFSLIGNIIFWLVDLFTTATSGDIIYFAD